MNHLYNIGMINFYKETNFMQETNVVNEEDKFFPNPFYRVRTVCEKLDMGKSTIFKYTSLGLFPKPIQLSPRMSVYKGSELEHWVKEVAPQLAIQSRQPKSEQKRFYS